MGVVDCDVHPMYPPVDALRRYLPARWKEFLDSSGFRASPAYANSYPPGAAVSIKPGADLPAVGSTADSLLQVKEQVLDLREVDYGILNCYYGLEAVRHPDWAGALAGAVNDWLVGEWLDKESRLRASVVVAAQFPELAAREITRMARHPGFVQVLLPVRSERPYGNPLYDPLYQAAADHGLVVGIHFGGMSGNPPTWVGWPTYYFEEYVGMSAVFQSQVISLITEGAFERFPTLKVAMLEGGWTWLPSLMWRLDKEWKGLRRETPWVKALPSEYIRKHMRFSLQPIDAPPDFSLLRPILDQLESDELLMFGSDHPHLHASDVDDFLVRLPSDLAENVMSGNARRFYNFHR